jgi:hypothetical protein
MPQKIDPKIQAAVKIAYTQSKLSSTAAVKAIGKEFKISDRKIWQWIKDEGWENDRSIERLNNPPEPPPKVEKVIAAYRPAPREAGPINQLEIVERAIGDLTAEMAGQEFARDKAQIANALKGMLQYHAVLKPKTAKELALQVVELGIPPAEFVAELKAAGWGRNG